MAWKGFTTARIMLSLHKYCAHCRSLMISYDIFFSFIVNLVFQCLHTYLSAPRLMFLLYGYLILYWQYAYIYIYMYVYRSYHCYWKEQLLHLQINLVSHFCDAFTYNLCLFTKERITFLFFEISASIPPPSFYKFVSCCFVGPLTV